MCYMGCNVEWWTVVTQVCGSHGVIQANNPLDTAVTRITSEGVIKDPLQYYVNNRFAQSYASEMNHLVDCIQGKQHRLNVNYINIMCNSIS